MVAGSLLALPTGPAAAGPPGSWTDLGLTLTPEVSPGLARDTTGALHIIYPQGRGLVDRKVAVSGTVGSARSIAKGWAEGLHIDPEIVRLPSGTLLTLAAGSRTFDANNTLSSGALYGFTSANGGATWNPQTSVQYSPTYLTSESVAATSLPNGTVVTATLGGSNGNKVRIGLGSSPTSKAFTYARSWTTAKGSWANKLSLVTQDSQAYAVWHQYGSREGTYVRRVHPSLGSIQKAPRSSTTINGVLYSKSGTPVMGTAAAARTGGGVHVAYCILSSTKKCTKIGVWKVGTKSPLVVSTGSGNAGLVTLSKGPGGRVWLAWVDAASGKIKATRSNRAAGRFGPVRGVTMPYAKTPRFSSFSMTTDGSRGKLDVVLNRGRDHNRLYHTQVRPGLTITPSIRSWSGSTARKVQFRVTDAGNWITGSRVKVGSSYTCTTNAKAVCTITIKAGRATTMTASASKAGYAGASVSIKRR